MLNNQDLQRSTVLPLLSLIALVAFIALIAFINPAYTDRTAKYNRLLNIEHELQN